MWRMPVTLGGGIIIEKGNESWFFLPSKCFSLIHVLYHFSSDNFGS